MRYLYISYNTDKSLKDTQWYETLEQVKSERGITCSKEVLERTRVASYSSTDKSGCYILDFNNKSIDDIDTMSTWVIIKWHINISSIMKLMVSVKRELKLKEILTDFCTLSE